MSRRSESLPVQRAVCRPRAPRRHCGRQRRASSVAAAGSSLVYAGTVFNCAKSLGNLRPARPAHRRLADAACRLRRAHLAAIAVDFCMLTSRGSCSCSAQPPPETPSGSTAQFAVRDRDGTSRGMRESGPQRGCQRAGPQRGPRVPERAAAGSRPAAFAGWQGGTDAPRQAPASASTAPHP